MILAWIAGIFCAGILLALAWLAIPLLPASFGWVASSVGGGSATATDAAPADATGVPTECRQLYDNALWASLTWETDSILVPSTDPPVTTAVALTEALAPAVTLTCTWTSATGTVSTTLATVGTDAGQIAATALPSAGFACEQIGDRQRCTRTDGELVETIEAGGGLWVSTSSTTWHPSNYAGRVAKAVWKG